MSNTGFIFKKDLFVETPESGISRQLLGYDETMMMLKISFEKGVEGAMHQHQHTQATFVECGVFEFTIGEEKRIVKQGDACFMVSNILHGCVCLEAGTLIDVFTGV
ncbi:cupin domain-containing protein [Arachidicoccus sp.]|uniref:cupin domain-containing protein n=1 Tax=Arachidicoccus sp. TaxID=1872624 RepID=UPI003D21C412